MKKIIHSPAPWYTIDFGGMVMLTDSDQYTSNLLFDCDDVGDDIAQSNAIIASKAPDMYKALFGVLHHNDNVKEPFKLPKSLVMEITTILMTIDELKNENNYESK